MTTKTTTTRLKVERYYMLISGYGFNGPYSSIARISLVDSRSGNGDLNYRNKIASGSSATNACTGSKTQLEFKTSPWIYLVCTNKTKPMFGRTVGWTDLGSIPASPGYARNTTQEDAARNAAAIGIRKKIRETVQTWSGPVFLGELRESVRMIRRPAKALRDYTNQFLYDRQRDKRRLPRKTFGRVLSESWLEYSFGALPLINDISEIAMASLPRLEENRIKRVSFTAHADAAPSPTIVSSQTSAGVKEKYSSITTNKMSVRYIAGVRREVTGCDSQLTNIINLGGFDLSSVVPTAWELLPWSFFIDYFSNIGDVLSANYQSLSNVAWVNETIRWSNETLYTSLNQPSFLDTDFQILSYTGQDSIYRCASFERRSASIPFGELRFDLPSKRSQFFNMAALLRLQFSK